MKKLPNRALNTNDILKVSKYIPHFRGVFMRDRLPKSPQDKESGIINLDNHDGPGTHWVAYYKDKSHMEYFDSFGNLQPPKELKKYLGKNIFYNYDSYQTYDTFICGHLALWFLFKKYNK